jgi:hypothetical protein
MELLPLLRLIWRRRLALGAGVLAAVAVLVALGGTGSVTTSSAVAWTRVTLDTPKSQIIATAPAGADTLAWRASLMSHLMATGNSTEQLARWLHVSADQITVVDPTFAQPLVPTDTAAAAIKAAASILTPYALTVYADDQLPAISIEAAAPDTTDALRLAQAAVAVLESESSPGGHLKSLIPTGLGALAQQPFVVAQVSPLHVALMRSSSLPTKPIAAALFVFVVFCIGALVVLPRLSRRVRPRGGALAA